MFSIASMVPKLASKAASLVNGLDSEGHFLTFDNTAPPLRSLSKQESHQGRAQQECQLFHQQQGLDLLQQQEGPIHREGMSPTTSSLVPRNSSRRHSPAKQDSKSPQYHSQGLDSYPTGLPKEGLDQTQQEDLNGHGDITTSVRAEQTCHLSWRLDTHESENLVLPKRGMDQSHHRTSSSSSPSSSTGMEIASSVSESISRSISSSPKLTPRQMSLRGARKRLSDSGPNATTPFLGSQLIKSTNAPSSLSKSFDNKTTQPSKDTVSPKGTPISAEVYSGSEGQSQIKRGQTQYTTIEPMAASPPLKLSQLPSIVLEHGVVNGIDPQCLWQDKDDKDYVENNSRSYKRRAKSLQESAAPGRVGGGVAKRTRSSNTVTPKKALAQDSGKTDQGLTRKAKEGPIKSQEEKSHYTPKGLFSVTGDEYALKNNNDYCEACLGLGQFICCDTCPKAFHFSCCQPPVDPEKLPEEWNCNECRAKSHPPKPNAPGIFKRLMDNVDRMNPKSFALPVEIRTFFKGVEANSDGEYVDTLDYKPSALASTSEDPLQMRDSHGEIRICFHCGKSAYGGRMMISCEHCPLHWHLDCLSPPMASRPPTTRKWMCPNHADHILPRYRKRRDAFPIVVEDPFEPNDGDIEIIEEQEEERNTKSGASRVRSSLLHNMNGGVYRVPERSIQLGFLEKCQRLKQRSTRGSHLGSSPLQADGGGGGGEGGEGGEGEGGRREKDEEARRNKDKSLPHNLEILAAAVMAFEGIEAEKIEQDRVEVQRKDGSYEEVQDAVLSQLRDPHEREAYLQFRALQRILHEKGLEPSVTEWDIYKRMK